MPPPRRAPLDSTGEQSVQEMSYLDWSSMLLTCVNGACKQDAAHLLMQNEDVLEAGNLTNRQVTLVCVS